MKLARRNVFAVSLLLPSTSKERGNGRKKKKLANNCNFILCGWHTVFSTISVFVCITEFPQVYIDTYTSSVRSIISEIYINFRCQNKPLTLTKTDFSVSEQATDTDQNRLSVSEQTLVLTHRLKICYI